MIALTPASTAFINSATTLLHKGQPWEGCTKEAVDRLITIVKEVQSGKRIIAELVNIQTFVKRLQNDEHI